MWTSAKAMFSNAWDAILKAFRKFCQWVDKYIGTFARLKMKVDSLLKDSKNLDGKKIKSGDNKIEVTTGSKNLAVPGETGSEVTYITTGTELIKQVAEIRKEVDNVIDVQRSGEESNNDFADLLNSADFSDDSSIQQFLDAMKAGTKIVTDNMEEKAKKGHAMAKHDTAYAKAYSVSVLPGYQRVLVMIGEKKTAGREPNQANGLSELTDKFNAYDIKVVDGDPELKKTLKETVSFTTMSANDIEQLANELKKGLEEIITYRGSKQYLKSESAIRKLKESVDKMDGRRVNTDNDEVSRIGREAGKAAVAAARLSMRMLNAPTRVITFFDTYTNFCITLGRRCISAYETR
jgi:hypothetical protein